MHLTNFATEIIQKVFFVLSSAFATCQRKKEIESIQSMNKNFLDELISNLYSCHSLSAILKCVSLVAASTFKAEKAMIVLIQPNDQGSNFAYFYSFSDAHIYNFDYAGTFVEGIVNSGEIVTFPKDSEGNGKVQSINEEDFDCIHYIPAKTDGRVTCIAEICYKNMGDINELLKEKEKMIELETTFSQIIAHELKGYSCKLRAFLYSVNNIVTDVRTRKLYSRFSCWRKAAEKSKQQKEIANIQEERSIAEKKVNIFF